MSTTATTGSSSREQPEREPAPAIGSRQALLVRVSLAAGLLAVAVALGLVLTGAPATVIASNGVPANLAVGYIRHAETACESGGTIPQGTQAIRVSLSANTGPKVGVKVFSGQRLVAAGEHEAGWGIVESVTVPIRRLAHAIPNSHICTSVGPVPEALQVNGTRVKTPSGAIVILLRMEYMRPGNHSWLSLAGSVAHDMGLERSPGGTWVAYLMVGVMLAVVILASRLLLREAAMRAHTGRRGVRRRRRTPSVARALRRWLRPLARPFAALRRVPRAAWTCVLVASLSAACWSLITPPFEAPDEPSHFAYAQLLAETGRLPASNSGAVSQEEVTVMQGLHQREIEWHPENKTFITPADQQELQEDLAAPLKRAGPGAAGVAASEPPLYYALATIPYYLGANGTLLTRLELMRLLSALLAGLTALFVFLFVREYLPGAPWAWTVGGLAAAVTPLLGFTSGAVTPDTLLYTVSAAIFFCLARAFRRGLTRKRALALGTLTAMGFLTKLNFLGLVPGVFVGLIVLAFRGVRPAPGASRSRRRAFGSMALAMAIAVTPVCVYVLSNLVNHHHLLGIVTSTGKENPKQESLFDNLSFIWQFYLPRLPGMSNDFPGLSTIHQLWFNRSVGFYGWLDTSFPPWVDSLALIPAALIAALGLRTLFLRRGRLRSRLPEIVVYLIMSVGLMALIGQDLYVHRNLEGTGWAQPRYLVPLLPLLALALAAAARGAGRRLGPAVGALIVVLFLAQDVFGQLLTVARFYM